MNTYLMNNLFIKQCRLYIMHLTSGTMQSTYFLQAHFLIFYYSYYLLFLSVQLFNYLYSMSIAQH